MYIMFPIGIMYYFGTNLDEKFAVPDFWPKREETHTIPYDRKEIEQELERLKARRLAVRARRLEVEARENQTNESPILQSIQQQAQPTTSASAPVSTTSKGWFSGWQ